MSHRLARLSQHLFRSTTPLPLQAGALTTKTLSSSSTNTSTRLLSSSGKHKPMSDEVEEARKAAAKQMEEAADAGTVSHQGEGQRDGLCGRRGIALFTGRIWSL